MDMNKNLKLTAATLLCMVLAACGGGTGKHSDILSDGILGEYGSELYDMMTKMDAIGNDIRKLFDEFRYGRISNEDCEKQRVKLEAKREALCEEFSQKTQEAFDELQGKKIPTIIEEDAPLKVVEPFRITELRAGAKTNLPSLEMGCECTVELTKETPVSDTRPLGSGLMDVKCEDKSNNVILGEIFGWMGKEVSIVGGVWPKDVYPAGTKFVVRINKSASYTSKGISKDLFQLHHITICWSKNHFVLRNRKLGPIVLDKPIANLPASVTGLYDKFEHKTEKHEDDMDGEWVEDYYLFTKNGKDAFRVNIMDGVAYDFNLLEGSTNVKDRNGVYVGFPARKLFESCEIDWQTDFAGWIFGTYKDCTYYIKSEDLVSLGIEVPCKAEDIKEDAKIARIDNRY